MHRVVYTNVYFNHNLPSFFPFAYKIFILDLISSSDSFPSFFFWTLLFLEKEGGV